jgi:hypothetical protein
MRRCLLIASLCVVHSGAAGADALDDTMQPFCKQSAIVAEACQCATKVMRGAIPGAEMDIVLRFARNQVSKEEIAKLPDGGASVRTKFVDAWAQAQTACGIKK